MPGTPLVLGPFTGGLNTVSDPAAILDNELVDITNLELDIDGSLVQRPAIKLEQSSYSGFNDGRITTIGYAYFNNIIYVIGATNNGIWHWTIGATNWTLITGGSAPPSLKANVAIQWLGKLWIIADPTSTQLSGYWTPSGGFVPVAAMPRGNTAVVHKGKMYVTQGTSAAAGSAEAYRLRFSAANDALTWPALSTADVNSGDGQAISKITVFSDNLLIFKLQSTYSFAFDSDPSQGTIRKVSGTIGAINRSAVAEYENALYIYHRGSVYEMINYTFTKINQKVSFVIDGSGGTYSDPFFVQIINDRLVIRYYNNIYSFNLRTRTWSKWKSTSYFGPMQSIPKDLSGLDDNLYIGGCCLLGDTKYFSIYPKPSSTTLENFVCTIQTKNYDLSIGYKFKRLFWWGADVACQEDITGILGPINYVTQYTWNDLIGKTWSDLFTWDSLLNNPTVTQTVVGSSSPRRTFFKFPKSIRFRQAYFGLSVHTDGTTATGPVRIFSLMGVFAEKEIVPKAVN